MDEHTLCVVFDCPIVNENNTQQLLQVITSNLTPDINHIYLLLNTPGGSVNLGIVIYNFLKSLPIRLTTHNIGQVDSIGNVIFVAGSERFATSNSTFLFHGIATGQIGGASLPQLGEILSQVKNDEQRMTTILRTNTSLLARDLNKFYREGRSITPEFALEKGVITDIKDVEIAPTAKTIVVQTSR